MQIIVAKCINNANMLCGFMIWDSASKDVKYRKYVDVISNA